MYTRGNSEIVAMEEEKEEEEEGVGEVEGERDTRFCRDTHSSFNSPLSCAQPSLTDC